MTVGRNVTIDPQAPATPAKSLEIEEVIDRKTGDVVSVRPYISSFRYGDFVQERGVVRESFLAKRPRFICALCSVPVYIVANTEKRFFFRHGAEDGFCPAQTRTGLTQEEIRARKYHGLKESDAHKAVKALIERSLKADSQFSDVEQET